MKSKRSILLKVLALVLVLVLAGVMALIGRGHTVFFDNKTLEYDGQTYETPYKVVVNVDGKDVAKLKTKERGMATWIGQNFKMTLEITETKGGEAVVRDVALSLPYGMDGVILNLPGLLAGLPEEAYLSEFVAAVPAAEEDTEDVPTDEFELPSEI